jgi:hypothetical protein
VVLNIDELIFSILAPGSAHKLIQSVDPLPMRRKAAAYYHGLDAKPVITLLFGTVGLICVSSAVLGPQIETLNRARSVICDGNLEFVAGVDQTGLVFASGPKYTSAEVTDTYAYGALRYLIEDAEAVDEGMAATGQWLAANWDHGISEGHWSVKNMVDFPIEEASELMNPNCRDADRPDFGYLARQITRYDDFWRVARLIMQDAPRLPSSITSCEDIADYCNFEAIEGTRARQYCPETCGCSDPTSGLAHPAASSGCPKSCRAGDLHRAKLGELRCADWAAEDPQAINGTDVLSVFLSSYVTKKLTKIVGITEESFRSTLSSGGCPAVVEFLQEAGLGDLCVESNPDGLMPITLLCPVTCRCDQSGALMCPPACGLVAEADAEVNASSEP